MKVEAVRGSLTVWLVRRARFEIRRLAPRGPSRLVLRPVSGRRADAVIGAVRAVEARCDCPRVGKVHGAEPSERKKLDLHWPSDDVPAPEPIVIRVRERYAPPIFVGDFFDLFL